jgi:outer membrane receptor for ferrienterochelin and colicins
VRLGAGRRSADPWDRDPRDAATTGNQTSGFDVSGQVGLTSVDGRSGVRLSSDYQWRDAFGIDSLPTGAVFDRRERNEWFNTTLAGRWAPSEVLGFDLQLRHSLFRSQFQQDQRAALDEDRYEPALERMWMATATSDLALGERHQLTAGVEPTLYLNSAPRLEGGRGQRVRTGLFLQDAWAVLEDPKLTLLGGVRLDLDSQFGSQPSPRFSALWEALPEVTVRGSHGWGFRAPSFTELLLRFANPGVGYVVEGNPDLKPERSHGATVSADWKVGPRLQVGASLFRTELQDLIAVTTLAEATPDSPLRYGYDNIARALTQGGELTGRINTWTSTWLDLGYALTDARDRDSGELLEGRAVHRLTAQLSGQWREAGLEWMVRTAWSSGRRFTPDLDGDGTLDPVWTAPLTEISARVGWRPWQRVQLFAGVNNLLDQGDALYLPIPPLQLYGGASVEL